MTADIHCQPVNTSRLILRRPDREDWPAYAQFMETEQARFFAGHRNRTAAWRSFGAVIWHWIYREYGPWAVTIKGSDKCVGLVGPKFPEGWPEGEITWMIFGTHEGKGLAREAAHSARAVAYARLGWTTAVSYIEDANTRSIALAKRLGARLDQTAQTPSSGVRAYRHPSADGVAV